MNYKVGDSVRIKSIDWYNRHTNGIEVDCGEYPFTFDMKEFCGQERIIANVCQEYYLLLGIDDKFLFTDEMIEGLAEEETKPKLKVEPKFKIGDKTILDPYPCIVTDVHWRDSLHGFVYTVRGTDFSKTVKETDLVFDEKTVPNTKEIIKLIKNDWNNFKDRYDIPDDYHFVDKNGNEINISEIVLEKKKKEYPKTYEECCTVLGIGIHGHYALGYESDTLSIFQNLIICRNAYWKIAGDEMGLGKPWEPDYDSGVNKYGIICMNGVVQKSNPTTNWERHLNKVLEFPTPEMRDAFKKNFDPDIEFCKEFL